MNPLQNPPQREPSCPPVSVVIPAHNASSTIAAQVRAVAAQLGPQDELLVVDNRSTDHTVTVVAALSTALPVLTWVDAAQRLGAGYARNVGIAASRHDLILFCDADDVVHPGWVEALVAALQRYDLVGGTAYRVPVSAQGQSVVGLATIFRHHRYPVGANMACRRSVTRLIGGFDESFRLGHEEVDFAWRAQDKGCTLGAAPEAGIDYTERDTAHGQARRFSRYGASSILLWCRHRDGVPPHTVSLRGAVRGAVRAVPDGIRVWLGRADRLQAQRWGWAIGVLAGHLRFRVFGDVPPSSIPRFD